MLNKSKEICILERGVRMQVSILHVERALHVAHNHKCVLQIVKSEDVTPICEHVQVSREETFHDKRSKL